MRVWIMCRAAANFQMARRNRDSEPENSSTYSITRAALSLHPHPSHRSLAPHHSPALTCTSVCACVLVRCSTSFILIASVGLSNEPSTWYLILLWFANEVEENQHNAAELLYTRSLIRITIHIFILLFILIDHYIKRNLLVQNRTPRMQCTHTTQTHS